MPPVFVLACDLHMDLLLNVMTLDTSGVTLYFVCVNKCQKNSLPSTWLPAPFVWFDLFSQTELKASGATVKILKGVRGRDVKCLIMEPDNMIHRLQTATSPETIKPGDKNEPNVFLHTKNDICTNRIPDSQCTFSHIEWVVLWKKTAGFLFFSLHLIWLKIPPQLQMTFCCSYPQSLWSLTFKRTNISKGNCPNFCHRLCFLQRFFVHILRVSHHKGLLERPKFKRKWSCLFFKLAGGFLCFLREKDLMLKLRVEK